MNRQDSFLETLYQKISAHQAETIKWLFFTLGIFFAFLFPKTAKKLRSALAIISLLAVIPSICKLLAGLHKDVKRLTA